MSKTSIKQIDASVYEEFNNHEKVIHFQNVETGLEGYIAIHNSKLGNATGGTRMFPYIKKEDALNDALRLSTAMTYKCSISDINHGGGKAVIIGNPSTQKNNKLLTSFAKILNELDGEFTTGTDVGLTYDDIKTMQSISPYIQGRSGKHADPSPFAAFSTFSAIQSACSFLYNNENLNNKKIAIKGLGKVGQELCRLLINEGAQIIASEINQETTIRISKQFPEIKMIPPQDIHKESVDIYCPCALGQELNLNNINEIRAKIICGAANNQLSNPKLDKKIHEKNIVYIPDFVANAGGLINIVDELEQGYNESRVLKRIENLKQKLLKILETSKRENKTPNEIALKIAEEKFYKSLEHNHFYKTQETVIN